MYTYIHTHIYIYIYVYTHTSIHIRSISKFHTEDDTPRYNVTHLYTYVLIMSLGWRTGQLMWRWNLLTSLNFEVGLIPWLTAVGETLDLLYRKCAKNVRNILYYSPPREESFTILLRERNPLLFYSERGILYYSTPREDKQDEWNVHIMSPPGRSPGLLHLTGPCDEVDVLYMYVYIYIYIYMYVYMARDALKLAGCGRTGLRVACTRARNGPCWVTMAGFWFRPGCRNWSPPPVGARRR